MQSVLDPPVCSRQTQQLSGVGLVAGQACHSIDDFPRAMAADHTRSVNPTYAFESRPVSVASEDFRYLDAANLPSPVLLARVFGKLMFTLPTTTFVGGKTSPQTLQ